MILADPRPELLRDKYPDLEFIEEKYHVLIPKFEDYENVLFLHPLSESRPATLDFAITAKYAGTLHLAVKNYPFARSKSRGTLIRIKKKEKGRDVLLQAEEIPIEEEWTELTVEFDHQPIRVEQVALDWDCEGLFLHYEFEEKPSAGGPSK